MIDWFPLFRKKKEELPKVVVPEPVPVTVPEPMPVLLPKPESEPVPVPEIEKPKPAKSVIVPSIPKAAHRMTEDDMAPFGLGRLQEALQIYMYIMKKGFTLADLAEYVEFATKFRVSMLKEEELGVLKTKERSKSALVESPQRMPLTREERKKFRKRR